MQCLAVLFAVFGSVGAVSYLHTSLILKKCIYIYVVICVTYKHKSFHQGTVAHQEAKGQHHLVGLVAMIAGTP